VVEEPDCGNGGTLIERSVIGDVGFIEWQGVLGQYDVSVDGIGNPCDARAVAPEVFFLFFDGAIRLLLVGRALDAQLAVGIACEPQYGQATY
jgi:hypothetical protein